MESGGGPYAVAGSRALTALAAVRETLRSCPQSKQDYPAREGAAFQTLAQLIRCGLAPRVATIDLGQFDAHANQGAAEGHLARRLDVLARSLRAFREDLGDRMARVTVVGMTEFGRTASENGTGGTDHGYGAPALVMGGLVKGGQILGPFPGLDEDARFEGRDISVTTDYRAVLAAALTTTL